LAKPRLQVSEHWPALHVPAALAAEQSPSVVHPPAWHWPAVQIPLLQTVPQAPQSLGSTSRLASQPLAGLPSQSAKPRLQVAMHVPPVQVEVALGEEQTVPQAPQWLGSLAVLVSQPLAGLPSQSVKPTLQVASWHWPAVHTAVPLAKEQTVPQAPQWLGSLPVLVSQPLPGLPSQSVKPG
jgi:hypothetical protein